MNQKEYDEEYGFVQKNDRRVVDQAKYVADVCLPDCSLRGIRSMVYRRLPLTNWLRKYKWKTWLFGDVVAGATLGIYNIPQSLSYSVLASLPPVYGLYTSFFPPLFYFLFGSSCLSSIGVFSITSLLTGQARRAILPDNDNDTSTVGYIDGMGPYTPIDVVIVLTFTVGAIQLAMAVLRLDFLTTYLSDPLVAAFNMGSACHAFISQVPALMGVKVPSRDSAPLVFFEQIYDICAAIPQSNVATVITSVISIAYLLGMRQIMNRVRWLKLFPSELLLMIVATVISTVCDLKGTFGMKTIDEIATGIPPPVVPDLRLVPKMLGDALSIAIVAFAVTVSMGKYFGKKYNTQIDPNQELLALGLGGVMSSFFSVFPHSTSLSRSLVNESVGARTQMSGIVASIIVLMVILFLGPLLEALPLCVLSSIVVVALRSLFMKVTDLPYLWRFSKIDFMVWIVTAGAVILYDLIPGLIVGILFALVTVVLRTQFARTRKIVELADGTYHDVRYFPTAKETSSPIIRFDAPPIFTNCEYLKEEVLKAANEMDSIHDNPITIEEEEILNPWRCIVLDCSTWTYTDSMGIETVKEIHLEMCSRRILILFAQLRCSVRVQYEKSGLYDHISDDQFYPSIDKAVKASHSIMNVISTSDLKKKLSKYF